MSNPIFDMFARSPIRPAQKHMTKAFECVKELRPFLDEVLAKNWNAAAQHYKTICRLEHEADEIKRDIRLHLPKGLFLSFSRNDLLLIVRTQDKLANSTEDFAGLVMARKMDIPNEVKEPLQKLTHRCIDAAKQAYKAIHELDELVETGFRGHEVDVVEDMIKNLHEIETDTDHLANAVRTALFEVEALYPPVEVMFLYRIIDILGNLADNSERVGAGLQLFLAR